MSSRYPKLVLPKGYLSYSQWDCWIKNPARYIKEYFEDGERLDTRFLRFGSQFSKMVERLCEILASQPNRALAVAELAKEYPMDENMQSVLTELDINGISEFQIGNSGREGDFHPVVKVRGEIPILAFLDKYVMTDSGIQEYKTGLAKWDMARVQKHEQLPFYGVGLKWMGRPLPPYADLHWVPTREVEQERVDFWRDGAKVIVATGQIKSFHREFDEREFERMEELILRVAWEISDAYQDYLSAL